MSWIKFLYTFTFNLSAEISVWFTPTFFLKCTKSTVHHFIAQYYYMERNRDGRLTLILNTRKQISVNLLAPEFYI
jgi:hypothetical protein